MNIKIKKLYLIRPVSDKIVSSLLIVATMLTLFLPFGQIANATVSNSSDTMSRLGLSDGTPQVLSDHAIQLTTSLGVASTETIVVTLPSDFNGTSDGDGALDFSDVDLLEDTTADGVCDGTAETLVTSGPTSSEWSAVFSGTESRILTLTSGGASAIIAAGSEICIKIGENATGGSGNSQYENPASAGSYVITVVAGAESSQNITITILSDDQVAVTATVAQSITFTITDNAIGFGTLVAANARFATGDASGADGPTPTSAHNLTLATNATTGYSIKYNGATLTAGTPTIDVATISGDGDGTPGTEQFAINFSKDGSATVTSAYANASNNYSFVASTTTEIVTQSSPTATQTFGAYYLANITGATEAGSYSTTITYTASANF